MAVKNVTPYIQFNGNAEEAIRLRAIWVAAGTNVQIVLDYAVFADMQKAFDALSSAGTVTFPIHDAFWGAKFGMLTDAYGIGWMFNCETKKPGA